MESLHRPIPLSEAEPLSKALSGTLSSCCCFTGLPAVAVALAAAPAVTVAVAAAVEVAVAVTGSAAGLRQEGALAVRRRRRGEGEADSKDEQGVVLLLDAAGNGETGEEWRHRGVVRERSAGKGAVHAVKDSVAKSTGHQESMNLPSGEY